MKIFTIGFCIFSLLFISCGKQTDNEGNFSLLNNNTYTLNIDRVSGSPTVDFPSDDLQESDYTSIEEEIQYEVAFPENGEIVTIEPNSIQGTRINGDVEHLIYELEEGLLVGGRLVIWLNNDDFEAEYTIYGSGVPIARSERGKLE